MEKIAQRLYHACLSAKGAYEALKLVGADNHLPGYNNCLQELDEIIAEYQAISRKPKTDAINIILFEDGYKAEFVEIIDDDGVSVKIGKRGIYGAGFTKIRITPDDIKNAK